MYGQSSETPTVCPGEANCDRWAGTSARTRDERIKKACVSCSLFSTKLDGGKKHKQYKDLVQTALQIRRERLAGYPRPTHHMTPLQFQTLLMAEQMLEQEEMLLKQQNQVGLMG